MGAWINEFRLRYGTLLAARAQAELLVNSGRGLIEAAGGAVTDAAAELEGDASLRVLFGARCALLELPEVGAVLRGGVEQLEASVSAAAEITAAVGSAG